MSRLFWGVLLVAWGVYAYAFLFHATPAQRRAVWGFVEAVLAEASR